MVGKDRELSQAEIYAIKSYLAGVRHAREEPAVTDRRRGPRKNIPRVVIGFERTDERLQRLNETGSTIKNKD